MLKIKKYLLVVVLFSCICIQEIKAQADPHVSQYYMYPMQLNPAMSGTFNGNIRVSAIYRNQWANIATPFKTTAISADVNTNYSLNFGANLLHQTAGDGGYAFTNGYLTLAYKGIKFGENGSQRIQFGVQAGIINRRINPSKFEFGDQWNAVSGFNPSNPTTDNLFVKANTVFDAGAGILYFDGLENKKANLYFGLSAFHLTNPQDPFISNGKKSTIPVRYAVHGGVAITANEQLSVIPNFLFMKQGTAQEIMLGSYFQFYASDYSNILVGANYRVNDALVPFVGIQINSFTIGLSYDATISSLSQYTKSANSFELTLSYISKKGERLKYDYMKCPIL